MNDPMELKDELVCAAGLVSEAIVYLPKTKTKNNNLFFSYHKKALSIVLRFYELLWENFIHYFIYLFILIASQTKVTHGPAVARRPAIAHTWPRLTPKVNEL